MPSAYAACDERHTRNDFNLLRVTAPSHDAASAGVETILFPRRATKMGVRRPAPGCERGLMRRTCDAIASLDRPAQDYDFAAGRGMGNGPKPAQASAVFAQFPSWPERLASHSVHFLRNMAATERVPLQIEAHCDHFRSRFRPDIASDSEVWCMWQPGFMSRPVNTRSSGISAPLPFPRCGQVACRHPATHFARHQGGQRPSWP